MSKFFKTVGGEVYGKCSILFGPTPVEVTDKQLAARSPIDDRSCNERLAADLRLVEVPPPSQQRRGEAKAGEASREGDPDAAGTNNNNNKK